MRPVPNTVSAASPALRSTIGTRHALAGSKWVMVLKIRDIGDACNVMCHVKTRPTRA
jgi:hypothetical protein